MSRKGFTGLIKRDRGFEGSRVQGMLRNYKDLKVWQKAYELCLDVYKATKDFPKEEIYGITSQIRRASVSVPSNIAEGHIAEWGRVYTLHVQVISFRRYS